MALGEFSMGIDARHCDWLTPSERPMDPQEVRRLVQEFASEANLAVELYFPEGAEGVWPSPEALLRADRSFYELLGAERSDKPCRQADCPRGAISHSVLCRRHHFEMVRRRPCPFDEVPNAG